LEYIRRKGDLFAHARKAYEAGYYLEAMQIVHGFLEAAMRDLAMVSNGPDPENGYADVWDIAQELTLNVLSKTLFLSKKLSKAEYIRIKEFNRIRNNIIHKYFWEPYSKEYEGIPKQEYDCAFENGLGLIEIIYEKGVEENYKRWNKEDLNDKQFPAACGEGEEP